MRPRSLNFFLSAVFIFFFLLVTVLGLFSIERLSEFNRSSADVRDLWLPSTRVIGDLNNFTSDFRAAEGRYLLSSTPAESAANKKEIESLDRAVAQAEHSYETLRHSAAASALYGNFKKSWTGYRSAVDSVLQSYEAGAVSEAIDLYRTTSQSAYDSVSDALDHVTRLNVSSASAASDQADAAYRNSRLLIIVAMTVAAILVMIALGYVRRYISTPLLDLARGMRRLAGNDTDIEIAGTERVDEIGEMARALVVFRTNAIELILSQRSLAQQTSMLEEKLAQEQRLTQLQQDFVSMASHEFRTPLTVIDGQAQRLLKLAASKPVAEIIERARKIRKAVLRMTTVMETLLSSSSMMEGSAELYFHPVELDLRVLLEEVCQLHREVAPQSRIWQKLGPTPLPVLGDTKLLPQMFGNLISNALKYSPDGSLIEITASIDGDHVAVSVRDEGLGIPAKDLANIFGRYNRGSNVSGIVGTGVGLYLVEIVAKLHQGSVTVESEEGRGSCFTVRLPLLEPLDETATASSPASELDGVIRKII
ncbi:MAG: MCP four helix bundle domain-containing protein [Gammaproteobacteria bacterium]|nr:MCP four helix bundle domain-containing protein [Gammaproteobacteria bacterium]